MGRTLIICAGLFAGWAVGIKYTGGLSVILVGLLIASRLLKVDRHDAMKGFCLYAGSALLVFAPWMIKNTLYLGNPVFPFFYLWGMKTLNPWVNQAAAGYFAGITEYYSRSFWYLPGLV